MRQPLKKKRQKLSEARIFKRDSVKSDVVNPRQWFIDAMSGGAVSESGMTVNESSMMSDSAVWCAASFIATNIASLPCPVYRLDGRKKEKVSDHPLHKILNVRANDETVSMVFRETVLYHLLFWWGSVSIIERDRLNRIRGLWPVHPDRVAVRRDNGVLAYDVTHDNGIQKTYNRADVLHIPSFGPNGLIGFSMANKCRDSIGLILAMRSFANLFFRNGAHMGAIFEHPNKLGEQAHKNLTTSMMNSLSGLGKAHKLMILEEGMKVNKLTIEPEKAQLLEERQYSVTDVARWFNLPPHVLKDLSRATFSNIEHQGLELVKYSFRPWLVRLEQHYAGFLLDEQEQGRYIVKHNVEGLLRGDTAARSDFYRAQFQTGALTPNEIRELEDKNPINEPWADEVYIQLNMVPVSQMGKITEAAAAPKEKQKEEPEDLPDTPDKRTVETRSKASLEQIIRGRDRIRSRFEPLFRDVAQKIVNRETLAIQKELKKQIGQRSASDFSTWIDEFYRTFPDYIRRSFSPVFRSYAESMAEVIAGEVGLEADFTDELRQDTEEYLAGFADQYAGSSRGQIFSLMAEAEGEGEAFGEVQTRADEWHEKRAENVTRNETVGLANMLARSIVIGAGYKLVWRNRGTSCPFCRQLEGRTVSHKSESFLDSGTVLDGGDHGKMTVRKTLYAPLHKGCDCVQVAG